MGNAPMTTAIVFPEEAIAAFCQRWKIAELAVFGSVLREDFGPESDVDVLVTFEQDAGWGLLDKIGIAQELESSLGRRVDFITRRAIERSRNPIRRRAILETARVIYAA